MRFRLNRAGDRQLNRTLHNIAYALNCSLTATTFWHGHIPL
jgi:hypothetical protein